MHDEESSKSKSFPKFTKGYKEGYPLILKERMEKWPKELQEGDVLELTDTNGQFIARGYHGEQNKGSGWLFTWDKKQQLDEDFLTNLITTAIEKNVNFYLQMTLLLLFGFLMAKEMDLVVSLLIFMMVIS